MNNELTLEPQEQDIGFQGTATGSPQIVEWLESETATLLRQVQNEPLWKAITAKDARPEFVRRMMGEIYADIVGYQPHVIEAAIAAIGQFPRSMSPRLIKAMLIHQGDEFDHGEMAFRDAVGLGVAGDELRKRPASPEAFAVAGVWWMIAQVRDPFLYLGALYLFEGLTPAVTAAVKASLRAKGLTDSSLEYIEFHSTEDIKHANLVDHMIAQVATDYPDKIESIRRGFKYFRQVYPLPIWRAAYERAKQVRPVD